MDGRAVGTTPLAAFEAEAGEREVRVRADGYEEFRARVAIEGRGKEQRLAVALVAPADAAAGAAAAARAGRARRPERARRARGSRWTGTTAARRRSSSRSSRTGSTRSG